VFLAWTAPDGCIRTKSATARWLFLRTLWQRPGGDSPLNRFSVWRAALADRNGLGSGRPAGIGWTRSGWIGSGRGGTDVFRPSAGLPFPRPWRVIRPSSEVPAG